MPVARKRKNAKKLTQVIEVTEFIMRNGKLVKNPKYKGYPSHKVVSHKPLRTY